MPNHPSFVRSATALVACALIAGCAVDAEKHHDTAFEYEFLDDAADAAVGDDFLPAVHTPDAPRLRLLLTDAPLDVDAVFVTFTKVDVELCDAGALADAEDEDAEDEDAEDEDAEDEDAEDEEAADCGDSAWLDVVDEEITFDLLSLQGGVTAELGLAELAEGNYGQIRLHMSAASVVVDDEEFELTLPSGVLRLVGGFALEAGMQTEITLDFDAAQSVRHNNGQGWMIQPVVHIVAESTAEIPEPEDEEPEPEPEEEPDDEEPEPEEEPDDEPTPEPG